MQLDQQTLKALLSYCPDTGEFRRLRPTQGRQKVGTLHLSGYVYIRVLGRRYLAHRLAFLFMTGAMPAMVDHINGERADNRWANLRAATPTLNSENRNRPQGRNSLIGTYWYKRKGKWAASVKVAGKSMHLGYFDTAEAAHAVYIAKKRELHQGCAI